VRATIQPVRRADGKLVRPRQPQRGLGGLSYSQRKLLKTWLRDSRCTYQMVSDRLMTKWGITASKAALSEWYWSNVESVKARMTAGKDDVVLAEVCIKILPGGRVAVVVKKSK
jgi:hypothetical protein